MLPKPDRAYRVIVEHVQPTIDGGRFPIKRTVGQAVTVTADVFADGHDVLAAIVKYRYAGLRKGGGRVPTAWSEVRMEPVGNDAWEATFRVEELGFYEFLVEGWVDRFASWARELTKKVEAGLDVVLELKEGSALVSEAAGRAGDRITRQLLLERAALLASEAPQADIVTAALAPDLAEAMAATDARPASVQSDVFAVRVDRERARYGAWYEMFPRSYTPDPSRSATFDEAAGRLPAIAEMGFDVLYLPPIHPIGRSFRKGPNNTLNAGPGDPGSPWAIGGPEGGHTAVEPGLGTIEDFRRFRERAEALGLEVALDLAYQCSPDHPYVRSHPEWFRHRPDGTIKYAENPPKKYQDIYPLDFESPAWPALWDELRDVILFWIRQGVKIFRVDNPHTKAFRFWEWVIAEVQAEHPETIFLSEAFTRPKIMKWLAKAGFTQSYTYFTWRNTKAELTEYFTELTQTPVREYMRPNLFANTPDILHEYLQHGGAPAFQVRLILAATLGATYGIYSGFELCENVPVRPGSEEYLDSEKYQIKVRDWNRPGHITPLITQVNRIRRDNPALREDWSLRFHETDNDFILCYSKESTSPANRLLVVVNLDPFHMQHGWVRVPAGPWSLPGDGYTVEDLLSGERYRWAGEWNYVRLEPGTRPAHILRVESV